MRDGGKSGWLLLSISAALVAACERRHAIPAADYEIVGGGLGGESPQGQAGETANASGGGLGLAGMGGRPPANDSTQMSTGTGGAVTSGPGDTTDPPGAAGAENPPALAVQAQPTGVFSLPPLCSVDQDCEGDHRCRQGSCALPSCGNGQLDAGEECDDDNDEHTDGCELDCKKTRVLDIQGHQAMCALFSSGAVKCWGGNSHGELPEVPLGSAIVKPAEVAPLDFGTTRRVVRLEGGENSFCVIFEDGKARCWGANEDGQLGIGSREDYGDTPDETLAALDDLPFSEVRQIAPGRGHTCVLARQAWRSVSEVRCWGASESGQLGMGNFDVVDDASMAGSVALAANEPLEVRTGTSSTCLLFRPGKTICWGNNSANGLSGSGTTSEPNFSTDVLELLGDQVQHLASRALGSYCTFQAKNHIFCWGNNDGGRLGSPYLADDVIRTPVPIRVGDKDFVDFQSGVDARCGLTSNGEVYCFGSSGRAGYAGRYDPTLHPEDNWNQLPHHGVVDVGDFDGEPGIDPVVRLLVSRNSTCVEMVDHSIRCFGANAAGRLGYGFGPEAGPDTLSDWERIGDDETPGEAYARLDHPSVVLW